MDKIKLLTYSVIGLLLLNVGIIGFLFFSRPNRNPEGNQKRHKEFISEKLHFDANQNDKYESIIPIYKDKIDSLDAINRKLKSELYSQLKLQVVNSAIKDSIITLFLANQKHIEEEHFKHFQDIKSICKPTQLSDYNALTQELYKMFSNQNSKPHPPGEKPPRNEDFPRPPREENHKRPENNSPPSERGANFKRLPRQQNLDSIVNDSNNSQPHPRNRIHPRPPRDENRPPRPRRHEDRPRHPSDENRPPPPPRPDDEK
jgi:protein CpxP